MKLLKNGESGQTLIIVLAMMALGSLLVVPTLSLAGTSLKYHQVIEKNTLENYAADSGVEYALCNLGNSPDEYESNPLVHNFTLSERTVDVTAQYMGDSIYKITSTATSDSGSSTTIESYVEILNADYSYLFNNAITSPGDITIKPGTEVYGDIQYNGELDNKGNIYGEEITAPVEWPTAEEFSSFYWDYVDDLTPLPDGHTIDISSGTEADPYPIGPLYAAGNLTITGSGVTRLDGTIYVAGNLSFNPIPDITILLNSQTIYAEGSINLQPGCTTSGSGCIIAVGDVNFQPSISGDDFVFLMSLEGKVWLKPSNSFYGSVAGDSEVELMPGTTLNWVEPTEGLDFPDGSSGSGGSGEYELNILTWQISK